MPDYKYDVFISYHRGQRLTPGGDWPLEPDGQWVHDVFFPSFRHWMNQAYPNVRIAFDANLEPGTHWESTLQDWVRTSKCMVAVWNPPYFRSAFCRSEFHSMLRRSAACTPVGGTAPRLVIPIVYADGKWFDNEAKAIQYSKDFSKFSKYRREIVRESVLDEFVTAMQALCETVEVAIDKVPVFEPNFPWQPANPLPPAHAYPNPSLR